MLVEKTRHVIACLFWGWFSCYSGLVPESIHCCHAARSRSIRQKGLDSATSRRTTEREFGFWDMPRMME
ncbi:MAG: hypothetical protein LBQ02_00260 [Candidatus Nomurabacteria bacterium]|nr:hypothetical protein [Candidatus Nomurabacteria bacterium]